MGSDIKLCPLKFGARITTMFEALNTSDNAELANETAQLFTNCEQEKCAWWCKNEMCAARSIAELIRIMYKLLSTTEEK